ncbi:MAG: hypothetical protein HZC02_00815 [Candidatus Levybacteria bacterium]|nr:hypothetical protein [Candidatus Levybacteria bacterium]
MDKLILPQKDFTPQDVVDFMREQGYDQVPEKEKAFYRVMADGSFWFPFCFGPAKYVSRRNPRWFWLRRHDVRLPQVFAGWLSFTLSPEHGPWALIENDPRNEEASEKLAALKKKLTTEFWVDFVDIYPITRPQRT